MYVCYTRRESFCIDGVRNGRTRNNLKELGPPVKVIVILYTVNL